MDESATINIDLQRDIRLLPGYDPFAGADEYHFDEAAAARAIAFVEECCTHVKGELAGTNIKLEPWQRAVFGNLFGWKHRKTGLRRYRECLVFVPRKNAKTTMAAAIVCLVAFLDNEPGAELYSSAAERDQARLCFEVVAGMVHNEPLMSERAKVFKYSITFGDKSYKAISAQAGTKHGFNAHLVINDELHAHKTAELTEVLATSMGARRQPLMAHLTTSDYEREGSVCNAKHDYACKVRDGIIRDPSFLPVIYEASKDDDWTTPETWAKANPNLDVSISREFIERECRRAQDDPAYENTFKRLHLNIRTEQSERLLPVERWDACKGELPNLKGQPCWCGLDLGATRDFSAFVAVFALDDERYAVMPKFWIPQSAANNRKDRMGVTYQAWERADALIVTPGDEVDYARLATDIAEFSKEYSVQEIAADRLFQGAGVCQVLREDHGLPVIEHGQGFVSMAAPTRAFLELVGARQVVHDGNPVLRWMVGNLVGKQDEAGNWKPDKKKAGDKIDGAVAAIMAIGRATVAETRETESFYETHGFEFVAS